MRAASNFNSSIITIPFALGDWIFYIMRTIFLIKDVEATPEVLASWLHEQTKIIPADSEDSRLLEKRESNSIFLDKKLLTPEPIFIGKEDEVEIYGVLSKGNIQKHEDYVSFSMGGIIVKSSIDDEGRKQHVPELIRRNNQEYVVQIDFWPKKGGSWVEGKCNYPAFDEYVRSIGEVITDEFSGSVRVYPKQRGPNARTEIRYEVFNRLKQEHPEWSQAKVALEATDELREQVTADTVRNTYRSMGAKWERGNRIR